MLKYLILTLILPFFSFALEVQQQSELNFGSAENQNEEKTIYSTDLEAGRLLVKGQKNAKVKVKLHANKIELKNSLSDSIVNVHNITLWPQTKTIKLDGSGRGVLFIGGTRSSFGEADNGLYKGVLKITLSSLGKKVQGELIVKSTFKKKQGIALQIDKVSDLEFGNAVQGDSEMLIAPGNFETSENGSIIITGEPHKTVFISLPVTGKMITESGSNEFQVINVSEFTLSSYEVVLDSRGRAEVFIGATRSAISDFQTIGPYRGELFIEAVYAGEENSNAFTTISMNAYITSGLSITALRNLDFSSAKRGDAQEVIFPGSHEAGQSGSILITGEPYSFVSVTLPYQMELITADGIGPDKRISVNSFEYNGIMVTMLDGLGTAEVYIGATREAISLTQDQGNYAGDFSVEVTYTDDLAVKAVADIRATITVEH